MTEIMTPLMLPSNYEDMEYFIINNKVELTEHIISSIQFAIQNNLSSVELFNFKNSDFIVVLEYDSFKDNIDNILKFYLETEKYEFCERVSKLQKTLETHEQKKTKKRYKSKNSSK